MPAGFQAFNPDGSLNVDLGSNLGKVLGITYVSSAGSGSASFPGLTSGTPFAIFQQTAGLPGTLRHSISGNTLSWWKQSDDSYFESNLSRTTGYIVVGVY